MRNEPHWLPIEEIVEINRDEVAETRENFLLRDDALLEMAWAKPVHLVLYEDELDVVTLATALLFGIARLHPFEQGNKRTGFVAAAVFLELNGYELTVPDSVFVSEVILAVIEGRGTEEEFTELLRGWIVPALDSDLALGD